MHDVTTNRISALLDDPRGLEGLYRADPEAFRHSLEEAYGANPDSLVLRVWRARLDYEKEERGTAWRTKLVTAIAVALVFGALVRLPAIWLGEEWYYPRLAPSLVLLGLGVYFWIEHRTRSFLIAASVLALASVAYVSLLPELTDSVVMALIHLPIVFLGLVGLAFVGHSWRDTAARIRFVRYNGELVVLGSLVALGGFVFSGVTVALFSLVFGGIEEWYAQNIGVFGAVAVPIGGTYLYDVVFNRRTGIAAVLARVFAPLFLVMSVTYLIAAFFGGQNPFVDRTFLITFNGLLLVVLGIAVFSIVERGEGSRVGLTDYINLALATVTLLINAIALAAILFRLASYGFTPNRIIVLGANIVIMVHLAWICWTYASLVRRKRGFDTLHRVVATYLPVYVAWAVAVAFLAPVIFGFA